jgi:uncharacterized protein (TIGR03067 family)
MRTVAFFLLAVLFACSTGFAAPVPKPKDGENPDQARLQGTWKLESLVIGGMPPTPYLFEMTYEIRGDKLTMKSDKHTYTAVIKLETVDGLKRLTMTNHQKVDPDGKPGEKQDDVIFGYTIDGDKLQLATRPSKDTGKITEPENPNKPGPDSVVRVFTRVKDKN